MLLAQAVFVLYLLKHIILQLLSVSITAMLPTVSPVMRIMLARAALLTINLKEIPVLPSVLLTTAKAA
jgi:hypothetical protein